MRGQKKVFCYWGLLALLFIMLIKVDAKAYYLLEGSQIVGDNYTFEKQDGTLTITKGNFSLSKFLNDMKKEGVPFSFAKVKTLVIDENVSNVSLEAEDLYEYQVEKIVNRTITAIDLYSYNGYPKNYPEYFWCYEGDLKTPVKSVVYGTVVRVNEKLFHLHFHPNGGTGTMEQIDIGNQYHLNEVGWKAGIVLPVSTFKAPEGKCCVGWRIGSEVYRMGQEVGFTDSPDMTAYALWGDAAALIYKANGGSGEMEKSYGWWEENGIEVHGFKVKVSKCTFTPPYGKTFDHWEVHEKFYGENFDTDENSVIEIFNDTEIYAIWKDLPAGSINPKPENGEKTENRDKPENVVTPPAEEKPVVVGTDEEKQEDAALDTTLKKSKVSGAKATKKTITISWKKQTKGTKGYEIQYSTDKNFTKNVKTITVNKNKTTSKTIKKLKSKTRYYIRIRTFTGKDGKKSYSNWSKTKTVKTK